MARSQFRVSWIAGPDGRVIESHVYHDRDTAEGIVVRKLPLIGEDEMLVFEVTDSEAAGND